MCACVKGLCNWLCPSLGLSDFSQFVNPVKNVYIDRVKVGQPCIGPIPIINN